MKRTALTSAAAASALLAFCYVQAGEETTRLADGPGRDLTMANCAMCHSLDYIPMNAPAMNRAAWEKTIKKMTDKYGAPLTAENMGKILDYLSEHYSAPAP